TIALLVRGEVENPLQLTLADLRAMPHLTVKAHDKNGEEVSFDGVALAEILERAKPKLTAKCCTNAANACVIVRAADNYRAVFALAEIQPDFTDRKIILADRANGRPLTEGQGPLRLLVPGEKIHARWVRQVKALDVVRVTGEAKP